ncbi:MAG: transcription termination factor NusA [Candidatus Omnitrophica bacterium]|nr:transcription termination factor NusA [Candidatus Omnitrophota bacterium]MCM8793055.1 transcription termination factor NusA [Candidatus Omnitrophota bacterium]
MNEEILRALNYIEQEKGIQRETLIQAVESALISAARKALHLKKEDELVARLEPSSGKIRFFLGGKEIDSTPFSRIAAQTAKQVIIQKIREAERDLIFREFEAKKGEIVNGLVHRIEKGNLIIDLGKLEGIIFRREQSKKEEFKQGDRIKALCLEVRKTGQGPQVILSRSHPEFVRKLFEMEVPEVYEKIVEIKAISREAGERTKIAVWSKEEKVDPVGACVGVKGARVKNIVKELQGEKIDIIRWNPDLTEFVKAALAPAQLEEVNIDENTKKIQVIVSDDQLSITIGKKGQNVRLACKLTGWDIDVRTRIQLAAEKKITLKDIKGVGPKIAKLLEEAGLTEIAQLADSKVEELTKIKGIGKTTAEKIISGAKELMEKGKIG